MGDVCGLPLEDMPTNVTPLAAVAIVKALDEDGDVAYYARATNDLSSVEALGMAHYAAGQLIKAVLDVT